MSFNFQNSPSRSFFSKKFLVVAMVSGLSTLASAAPADFVGTWLNRDRNSRGIIRIVVHPGMQVQAYGSCTPNPCDWGRAPMTTYGRSVTDRNHKIATANYNFSFKRTSLVLKTPRPGLMTLEDFNVFTDNSGRQNYYMGQTFRKATQAELEQEFKATPSEPQD